jgi:hypothetical protein
MWKKKLPALGHCEFMEVKSFLRHKIDSLLLRLSELSCFASTTVTPFL